MIEDPSPFVHIDNIPIKEFKLSKIEAMALYDYFQMRAGYISYEFDMPVINLIRRLKEFLEGEEND